MRISIGGKTEEAMELLGIPNYPFSPEELSNKFRKEIKLSPELNNKLDLLTRNKRAHYYTHMPAHH